MVDGSWANSNMPLFRGQLKQRTIIGDKLCFKLDFPKEK
jgi:hypothetical protein